MMVIVMMIGNTYDVTAETDPAEQRRDDRTRSMSSSKNSVRYRMMAYLAPDGRAEERSVWELKRDDDACVRVPTFGVTDAELVDSRRYSIE
ncbi:hypothetical protein Trydic_g6849 [Trypoxylus dichotomus]